MSSARFQVWGISLGEAIALASAAAVPRRFIVHKFGKSDSLAAGETIMEPATVYPYLTYTGTPLAMRIKAGGDAADDTGGTGARSVTIQGLDTSFNLISETIDTNGIAASSATTATFSRVFRVFVETTGTGRVNAGAITIEDSGGAADYAKIDAGQGQSELGHFTVPAGYQAFLSEITVATDIASGSGSVVINGFSRNDGDTAAAPFPSKRLFWREPGLSRASGIAQATFDQPIYFGPKTDIWFEGTPSSGTPEVDVEFTLLVEKL